MLNIATVSEAAREQIENYADVVSLGATVERDGYVNQSPDSTPWVGVYKDAVTHRTRTLGKSARTFDAEPRLVIVVQTTDYTSGANCSDSLEALIKAVLDAVWSDSTLGGVVEMIGPDLEVMYEYLRDDEGTLHFQQATIGIPMVVAEG